MHPTDRPMGTRQNNTSDAEADSSTSCHPGRQLPRNARCFDASAGAGVFWRLVALYLVVLYPILAAGRPYEDDLKRALMGRTGWDSNGRFLTTFVMNLVQCYDYALVDISPLTQFAAIGLLAWAGVQLARRYAIRSPWMAALVTFPLGAQPFFMENLSFRFDSMTMALAVLLALQPIVTIGNSRRKWWLGVAAIFASLNLYQAAINVLLVFAMVDLAIAMLERRTSGEIGAAAWWRTTQIGLAMLIYQLLVAVHVKSWVKQHSQMIGSLRDLDLVPMNFLRFYGFVADSFNLHWWLYYGPVLLGLAIVPMIIGIRYSLLCRPHESRALRWAVAGGGVVLPLVATAFAIGPMLLLINPLILPRVLMGIGGLLAGALVVMQAALRQWRLPGSLAYATAGMFAAGMCVFSSAYGNALGEQQSFEQRLGAQISGDIAWIRATRPVDAYLIDGTAGLSPLTSHVASEFPLVKALVRPYLSAQDVFFAHYFLLPYLPDTVDMRHLPGGGDRLLEDTILDQSCEVPPARVSSVYSLYMVRTTAVIAFGRAHLQRCSRSAG